MTERKPPGVDFGSWVDQQIREAQQRGAFDDLPGAGKPLPGLDRPYDEMWWVRQKLESEGLSTDVLLPTPLALRKEVHQLPETVRELPTEESVRTVVRDLNRRIAEWIRLPTGPAVPVSPVRVDDVVEQWRADRESAAPTTGPAARVAPAAPPARRGRWRRLLARLRFGRGPAGGR